MNRALGIVAVFIGFSAAALYMGFALRNRSDAEYLRGAERLYNALDAVSRDLRERGQVNAVRFYQAQAIEAHWYADLPPTDQRRASATELRKAAFDYLRFARCSELAKDKPMESEKRPLLDQAAEAQADGDRALNRARQLLDQKK